MSTIKQKIAFAILYVQAFFMRLYNKLELFVERQVKKFENHQ